ncbi:MAG TPA: SUMF1/EgtB/PvdO family nonheme iron enzyme, partial [Planctomycetota bacterium]|nr:SUMF1/EgtB/PvdO family nonheme iron enzyme [Planctomycetota bacterium]
GENGGNGGNGGIGKQKLESERVKALAQRFATEGGTIALLEDAAKTRRAILEDSDGARAVRAEADELIEAVTRGELGKLRARLEKEGPRLQLFDDARALRRAVPAELPGTASLSSDTNAFLNELSEVENRMKFLESRPISALPMSPPFVEVTSHWRTVASIFDPSITWAPEGHAWLAAEKARHVDALWAAVAAAVKPLIERLPAALERFEAWDNGSELEVLLKSLGDSGTELERGLPDGKTRWAERFPPELSEKYRAAVEGRQALSAWLVSTSTEIERLGKDLEAVKSSLAWPQVDADLRPALEKLEAAVEAKRKVVPPAKLAKAVEGLERIRSSRDAWNGRASGLAAALEKMAAGDLTGAAALLEAPAGGAVIDVAARDQVLPAIAAARNGFADLIDRLDPRAAAESFAEAQKLLEMPGSAGGAVAWVERCTKRAADLELSARGMVRIRGARVRYNLEGGAFKDVDVKGFFLDRFEVSNREFAAFVASQDAVKDFEEVKALWGGRKDIFNKFRRGPTYLRGAGVEPMLPVEEVSYYQAAAFLRARGKSLPSLAEWWLAARGAAGREIDGIPCRDVQRNRPRARPVDRGGTARNFPDDPGSSVHHLSGNVAEWCEVEGEQARDTRLVGGSYRDKEDRKFTGEVREKRSLDEAQEGFGLRGVLRPEAFLEGLLPPGRRE